MRPTSLALALGLLAVTTSVAAESPIKSDEEVLFFRTGTARVTEGDGVLPIRGWIFEPEADSWKRRMLLRALAKVLGLPSGSDIDEQFKERARWFLVDSERGKAIPIQIGDRVFTLPKSGSDGIFQADVPGLRGLRDGNEVIRFTALTRDGDTRRFEGQVLLSDPEGVAVVTDIDDTIKVTHVKDRNEMLRNTFLRPLQEVEGMADAYRQWADDGAVFHYVSNSPLQLYPTLTQFLDEKGFPLGGVHLRSFWKKGEEVHEGEGSADHKVRTIEKLLTLYPQRDFILVGDSGESDPENYGALARKYPARIRRILIRRAPDSDESEARYQAAFEGLPADLWRVFSEPQVPAP